MTDKKKITLTSKERIELLMRKLIWALKYMDVKGGHGSMMITHPDAKSFKVVYWVDDFCDALEQCGLTLDREALDNIRHPKKVRKKAAK